MHPRGNQSNTAERIQKSVDQVRSAVLSGRGPGASSAEIFDHGPGRTVQAGTPVVQRLARTARDAALARAPGEEFVDGGLLCELGLSSRPDAAEASGVKQFPDVPRAEVRAAWFARVLAAGALVIIAIGRQWRGRGLVPREDVDD